MRRLAWPSVAVALLLAAPAAAAPREPLTNEGRWIVDSQRRVAVLHGLNVVTKVPPFFATGVGFGVDDARFLRRHGFNTVRLGIVYSQVEPQPGRYDDRYLREIAREVRLLARHGISVLLDFHQDQYNRRFQGGGFPDWAVLDDGLPAEPKRGFPFNYYFMPALQRAYDSFWRNRRGLQDRYAAAWRYIARKMRALDGLLGYDLMNEPWPGSRLDCSSWAGCPDFDRGPLTAFNRRVVRAIRRVDRRHLVWHEPLLPYGFGAPSFTRGTGDPRAGFSFHMYCIGIPGFAGGESRRCSDVNRGFFRRAEAVSRRTGDALLLTEFGANVRAPASVAEGVTLADRFMVGWQEWHYDSSGEPDVLPGRDQALVFDARMPPRGANVDHERLALLARPYPRLVAGTPLRWRFEPSSRRFSFAYRTARVGGGSFAPRARTEVFLPRLQYPDGYRAQVRGARIASPPDAQRLVLAARRGARRVTLTINSR